MFNEPGGGLMIFRGGQIALENLSYLRPIKISKNYVCGLKLISVGAPYIDGSDFVVCNI